MKTLNQMDETEFLRRCWLIADAVSDLLQKSKVNAHVYLLYGASCLVYNALR